MEKTRLVLAAALLAVSVSWVIPARSMAVEEAAGKWCAGLCHGEGPSCGPSALEGCLAQFASCANSHNSGPVGVRPSSGWAYQDCIWITAPGGIWPGGVTYACPSGYLKLAVGRCVALDELEENERPPCREPAGSGASPSTPNPISLLTGSKLLRAVDFETADGLLRVSRSYRSTPAGRAEIVLHEGAGLGSLWRFDFLPEFHIRPGFSSYKTLTLHWPDGSSWDFRKDNDPAVTTMVPIASSTLLPHSEFRVIFDGAWPSDLTLVDTASTQWKVIDPDG
ncbi:MAG: hypothetical protein HY899_03125, partial [Deltaproteobacteria bacterium]|nr:hypothetical protein [Deltaproteobacteria bacterium]